MKKLLIALALVLSGCASTGVQVKDSALTAFKPGVTTKAEIIEKLGPPTSTTNMNGFHFITYAGSQYQVRAASLIPVVGLFAGGSDVRTSMVMFQLDDNDVLLKINSNQSNSGTVNGFSAGDRPKTDVRAIE